MLDGGWGCGKDTQIVRVRESLDNRVGDRIASIRDSLHCLYDDFNDKVKENGAKRAPLLHTSLAEDGGGRSPMRF